MTQCSARVDFDAWRTGQCSRNAIIDRDGKSYCKIHDPEYIKQKDAKRQAKYESGNCRKCGGHPKPWWAYCPYCGTKLGVPNK